MTRQILFLTATLVLPHAALFALPFVFASATVTTWVLFAGLLTVIGYGVTVCYHRYFAHRSYKTSRAWQFVMAVAGCLSTQVGPLSWCAHHRRHHAHSDRDGDVHSPVRRGFWYAHLGWLFEPWAFRPDYRIVRDFARYPEILWLDRLWFVPPLLAAAGCYLLDGWAGVVIGYCLPVVISKQLAFAINSVGHSFGSQPYPTGDGSRNSWLMALLSYGEGWHNNHHHSPRMANHGWEWWQIDTSYGVILLWEKVGLVWDVKKWKGGAPAAKPAAAATTTA